jgi:hypothetical protein
MDQIQCRHTEYDAISITDQPALNMARTELMRLTNVKSSLQAAINNANIYISAAAKTRPTTTTWLSWYSQNDEEEENTAI